MSKRFSRRLCLLLGLSTLVSLGGGALFSTHASASDGLVVVIANSYEGALPGALNDGNAIADRLQAEGYDGIRLLGVPGSAMAAGLEQIRKTAEGAGPFRLIYATGFGMCLNDDLVLFADDLQPEQFKSGQVGDVVIPLSVVAEAAAVGGEQTLLVFDTNPRQCTRDALDAFKLPPNSALLVTTGIGGDVIDEIDDNGMSAFSTAFIEKFAGGRDVADIISPVMAQIQELTGEQQVPILIGKLQ